MATLVKTPCATAALEYFGVQNGVTWNERTRKNVWSDTLRRAGYSVRSKMSGLLKSEKTVGAARKRLAMLSEADPSVIAFVVSVEGHVLVVNRDGETVVDTDPRRQDRRKVLALRAVCVPSHLMPN